MTTDFYFAQRLHAAPVSRQKHSLLHNNVHPGAHSTLNPAVPGKQELKTQNKLWKEGGVSHMRLTSLCPLLFWCSISICWSDATEEVVFPIIQAEAAAAALKGGGGSVGGAKCPSRSSTK